MDCGLWINGFRRSMGFVGVIVVVCRGVIVAVVWWFACSVSEKREMKRKREKKIEMIFYCDDYIILFC